MEQAHSPPSNNSSPDLLLADLFDRLRQDGTLAELLKSAARPDHPKTAPAALADDTLYGADEIAEFLFGDKKFRRKVYNLVETGRLPHFRIGVSVCSRKSVLLMWIAKQEQQPPKQ